MRSFTDPAGDMQILVATINILGCGVNLYKMCHYGIFMNYHIVPRDLIHAEKRLSRIGQTHAVTWHLLKCKDTFNDYQERIDCAKSAKLIKAECGLPRWLPMIIREMSIYEGIKSRVHQPFNRHAWVILRELGVDLDLHDTKTRALGHLVSAMVRLSIEVSTESVQGVWCHKAKFLTEALYHLVKSHQVTADSAYEWLKLSIHDLEEKLKPLLREALRVIQSLAQEDEELSSRIEVREQEVHGRLRAVEDVLDTVANEQSMEGEEGGGGGLDDAHGQD